MHILDVHLFFLPFWQTNLLILVIIREISFKPGLYCYAKSSKAVLQYSAGHTNQVLIGSTMPIIYRPGELKSNSKHGKQHEQL